MLKALYLTDQTRYYTFVMYPMRDIGDDCVEPIMDGKEESAIYFSVFGVQAGGATECVADFDAKPEALGYLAVLRRALCPVEPVALKPDKPKE